MFGRRSRNSQSRENPTDFYSVTPLNRFCLECKNTNCKGICKEFKEYKKKLKAEGKI